MGDVIIEQSKLPSPDELYNQGKQDLSNLSELKIGAGSSIFFTDKEGSRWGSIRFDTAKAWIKVDGTAQFKSSDGDVLLSTSATDGNFINVINTALNTSSKTILQDFTFQSTDYAGAFKSGNPTWDEGTGLITGGSGVLINARGILGAANGVATFTLDATTGNATFAGTLTAASGTLGAITVGSNAWHVDSSGNMWWGSSSTYASATIKISSAGAAFLTGATISGSITATGGSITGDMTASGTLTVGPAATNQVKLDGSNGKVDFLYNGSSKGYIQSTSSLITISGDEYLQLKYNDGGGTGFLTIYNDTTSVAYFDDSNNFIVDGDISNTGNIQCGTNFKSSDGTAGHNGTRDIVMSVYNGGANYAYRTFTWKDGLLTSIGSEQTASS